MQKNHIFLFHNTTFVNCHQKARRKEAGQELPHGYYSANRRNFSMYAFHGVTVVEVNRKYLTA